MNRRTSKLMGYVAAALIQGKMAVPPTVRSNPRRRRPHVDTANNLKRKLKREWNAKPRPIRCEQRLGLIRTLIKLEGQHG